MASGLALWRQDGAVVLAEVEAAPAVPVQQAHPGDPPGEIVEVVLHLSVRHPVQALSRDRLPPLQVLLGPPWTVLET